MSINNSTVKQGNISAVGPSGQSPEVSFVGYNPADGNATYQLAKNWTYLDNGDWNIITTVDVPVTDNAGNPVQGNQLLTTFTVAIPVPDDRIPPTAVIAGPIDDIVVSGAANVAIGVVYSDVEG